jgi:hypothetical protein
MSKVVRAGVLAIALFLSSTGVAQAATYPINDAGTGIKLQDPTTMVNVQKLTMTTSGTTVAVEPGQPLTTTVGGFAPDTKVTSSIVTSAGTQAFASVTRFAVSPRATKSLTVRLPDTVTDSRGRYTTPGALTFTKPAKYTLVIKAADVRKTVIFQVQPQNGVTVASVSSSTAVNVRASVTSKVSTSFVAQVINRPVAFQVRGFAPRTSVTSRLILPDGTSMVLPRKVTSARGTVNLSSLKFAKSGRYVLKVKVGNVIRTVNIQVRRS